MFAVERRQLILQEAQRRGRVDVADIAARTGVSTETVRRDLTLLEQQNMVRRVHGGAVLVELVPPVPVLSERSDLMVGAKHAIGRAAATHLPQNGTVLIDAGSTTAHLAAAITDRLELTLVTNSVAIAQVVASHDHPVHVLGGRLRPETLATVDYWALGQLESLDIDVAFVGCYGVSLARGFSTPDSFESAIKRAMVKIAKRVVVLADSTKLNRSFMSVFAAPESVDLLITDDNADPAHVRALRDSGLSVEVARTTHSHTMTEN